MKILGVFAFTTISLYIPDTQGRPQYKIVYEVKMYIDQKIRRLSLPILEKYQMEMEI